MKLLLGWEEANPLKPDGGGRKPLSYAAEGGYEGVAKLLLEREEVNPDKPDHDGQTPLSFATMYGHNTVAPLLQARKTITPARHEASEEPPREKSYPPPSESVTHPLVLRHHSLPMNGIP